MRVITHRLSAAVLTVPNTKAWLYTAALLLLLTVVALPIGFLFNLVFLLLAALLGFVCSVAYLQSGSLWTSVVIHWLAVVVWLLLLGGYKKLYC